MANGLSPTKTLRMLKSINIATICSTTFKEHASRYIYPTIYKMWNIEQDSVLQTLAEMGGGLVLGGDGRADTPGHCAKYGTYTFIDLCINKIVDIQLVQVIMPIFLH